MANYSKETSRITIKFINAETEEQLFEIPDRNWMNMGEIFTDNYSNDLLIRELKGKALPERVLILAVSELFLNK
jgi:hypothetical protein